MMVMFISQCDKKAIRRTRRVIDAFANRIGDNVWQTIITENGLSTVKKMLRQTASKSTAVSCHWIRSRSRSQLLWVIGDKSRFNEQGVVPVNRTAKPLSKLENDWRYLPLIKSLAALAGLFHDWGKATALFQSKLNDCSIKSDPIRHEWISCLLLHGLIASSNAFKEDSVWLDVLENACFDEVAIQEWAIKRTKNPLNQLPPVAKLLAWLIVSHHKLPNLYKSRASGDHDLRGEFAPDLESISQFITDEWGYNNPILDDDYESRLRACFSYPQGLLSSSTSWIREVKKWSKRLHDCELLAKECLAEQSYRVVLHHTRLCLMLGDHYYSSLDADKSWKEQTSLYANTDKKTRKLKQKLDEHLVGVAKNALRIAHLLPAFETEMPEAQGVIALKKPSPPMFRWQDKAVEQIKSWRLHLGKPDFGFFAVNMASTGCGKTFANAKLMQALSPNGDSLRYILALGLRTLTLQTGEEYRQRVGLDNGELAVLIGSSAIRELHELRVKEENELLSENIGSESLEPLLTEDVDYDCEIPEEGLATIIKEQRDRAFLYSPVLACTIDHIIAATETVRGGRYILPVLRLMSSDLVIDEVDDFDGRDLIAIGRLIHLAGMLGRKVMISSATIPPDLAEGYFNVYREGWELFCKTRDTPSVIGCAWIDEFDADIRSVDKRNGQEAILDFREHHQAFIKKRVIKLSKQIPKRKAEIVDCKNILNNASEESYQVQYFSKIKSAILSLHASHHTVDSVTSAKVSFGVVRMANIAPCVALGKFLMTEIWPDDIAVKVMVYHSQQVLLMRHEQEKHLDSILKRKEPIGSQPVAFHNPIIRQHLDNTTSKNIIFIVVATPVEEVGRDHDFDWAVVEPSSFRSIIQLAGRVRRHRPGAITSPNINLMQFNWKTIKNGNQAGKKYFIYPGYEINATLNSHDLRDLLDEKKLANSVDSIPRVLKSTSLQYKNSLIDLEHWVTQISLANYQGKGPDKLQGYLSEAWYLTGLPQSYNQFRESEPTSRVFLHYSSEDAQCFFSEKNDRGEPVNREKILKIFNGASCHSTLKNSWLARDYMSLLNKYAEKENKSKSSISLRYGELCFPWREGCEYEYSDQFGLVEIKE